MGVIKILYVLVSISVFLPSEIIGKSYVSIDKSNNDKSFIL